jgi:retron-type reverse transcriptase
MRFYKKKTSKVPKGYRLKPSTHKLISKIQEMIQSDQDKAVSSACRMFYRELIKRSAEAASK